MIEIDLTRFKQSPPPFAHQLVGVRALVKHTAFALFDEMGAGKSRQVVDAACVLAEAGKINTVIVVAPAGVRCVWVDTEIGQIKKYSWVGNHVYEYSNGKSRMKWNDETPGITWVVTNYELLRGQKHLNFVIARAKNCNAMLVLDESSYIKSRTAQQSKAVAKLREHCSRCVILNGTPITQSPMDLWSQFNVLDKRILGSRFHNFYQFRSEYCEMRPDFARGRHFQKIVSYRRLDHLTNLLKPYVLRRLKSDCMDLPPKLYTQREVALTPESWKRYCELKKEAVASLPNGDMQLEPNAAVRIMRLSQLTSGHLGKQEIVKYFDPEKSSEIEVEGSSTSDLSSEKLDWCVNYLINECSARYVIAWCRFRRERERLNELLGTMAVNVVQLFGGQGKSDRGVAIRVFSEPQVEWQKRCVLLAQPRAGGIGLPLIAATEEIYLSNEAALIIRLQSEDRPHRPGQMFPLTIMDVLATGPAGQRTVDHIILKALRDKDCLAKWTSNHWRRELEAE